MHVQASYSKKLMYTPTEQLYFALQIAKGMTFISAQVGIVWYSIVQCLFCFQGYVHMDLAARNVLVHENSALKISDFGCVSMKLYYTILYE